MSKLFIIHFQPLEAYPPVQNIIRFLEKRNKDTNISIISTKGKLEIPAFESHSELLKIYRFGKINPKSNSLIRLLNYLFFYLSCLWQLIFKKPDTILYIETLSSFPAIIYKNFINRNVRILIHYHEYTSPAEYRQGMFLNRKFHEMEKALYPNAAWVSHTNQERMNLFLEDISPTLPVNPMILSNYPPEEWKRESPAHISKPVRIIYVGALSLESMYLQEFSEWVDNQNGNVYCDIYSINITKSAQDYLSKKNSKFIKIKEGIPYEKLKNIIQDYDIGVILYKGVSENHIFSAPNKLFEYAICGLDVWFPDVLTGSSTYITSNSYPKIISLNFSSLAHYNLTQLIDRSSLIYKAVDFNAGEELEKLYTCL